MKVYLDNNILILIEQKQIAIEDIRRYLGSDIEFVYSSVHIKEFLEIGSDYYKYESIRLETIRNITKNLYIKPYLRNIESEFLFIKEEPKIVLDKVQSTHYLTDEIKMSAEELDNYRTELVKALEIDITRLYYYPVEEVIVCLNRALKAKLNIGLETLINGSGFFLQDKICSIFNILDLIGFWKDKKSSRSNMARIYDALHSYYACGCNVFVTNDERCVPKAKVAYSLYNIGTRIIYWDKREI